MCLLEVKNYDGDNLFIKRFQRMGYGPVWEFPVFSMNTGVLVTRFLTGLKDDGDLVYYWKISKLRPEGYLKAENGDFYQGGIHAYKVCEQAEVWRRVFFEDLIFFLEPLSPVLEDGRQAVSRAWKIIGVGLLDSHIEKVIPVEKIYWWKVLAAKDGRVYDRLTVREDRAVVMMSVPGALFAHIQSIIPCNDLPLKNGNEMTKIIFGGENVSA